MPGGLFRGREPDASDRAAELHDEVPAHDQRPGREDHVAGQPHADTHDRDRLGPAGFQFADTRLELPDLQQCLLYTLTGGGPANATTTLPLYVARVAIESKEFGYGSALTVSAFVILGMVTILYLRLTNFGRESNE